MFAARGGSTSMADPRNTIGGAPPPALRPVAPVRSEAARAAQRAFFEAALGKTPAASQTPAIVQVQTPTPTAPTRPISAIASLASAISAKPSTQVGAAIDAVPSRTLRPGSIIDIKV
jgi:hypothetical protein